MAGAMKGFMITDEHDMKACKKPEIPDMVKQAETMLPMMDMMVKQMNAGVEPMWMTELMSSEHALSLLAALTMGEYNDTEFCRGMIMAFEGKKREATRMGGGSDLQKLSGGENCLLGMVTGVMAKACNYPFLVWKNTQQQGLPLSTTWTTAKGGFNPLLVYRGLPMACMNLGGTNAVQFGTTGFFQKLLANYGLAQDSVQVGGAFLGGLASGIPCSVWELCMIQQQRFGGSTLGTPARIVQEFGLTDLGRGATMTMGRESMFTMSMLGVTPLIQQRLVETSGWERNTALAAGSLTGALLAGVITHPMDTIKSCMQGDMGRVKYNGIVQTGQAIAAEHGVVQGLFKGLFYRIALISTTFFLVNTFKEKTVPLLFPHVVDKKE